MDTQLASASNLIHRVLSCLYAYLTDDFTAFLCTPIRRDFAHTKFYTYARQIQYRKISILTVR